MFCVATVRELFLLFVLVVVGATLSLSLTILRFLDLFEVDDGGVKWEGEYDDDDDEDLDGFIVDDNMNE